MSCSRLQRPRVTGGIVSGPASTRWSGVDREQDSLWGGRTGPRGPREEGLAGSAGRPCQRRRGAEGAAFSQTKSPECPAPAPAS